jgi:hypothetical protein
MVVMAEVVREMMGARVEARFMEFGKLRKKYRRKTD